MLGIDVPEPSSQPLKEVLSLVAGIDVPEMVARPAMSITEGVGLFGVRGRNSNVEFADIAERRGLTSHLGGSASRKEDSHQKVVGDDVPFNVILRKINSGFFARPADIQLGLSESGGEIYNVITNGRHFVVLMCRGSMFPSCHHSHSRRL